MFEMFDKFKSMGALAGLLQNKERLREAGERIRTRAAEVRAVGEAGGGAVRITADGRLKIVAVELQPALVAGMAADDQARELAGTLIAEAANTALAGAQEAMKAIIAAEARELGLPELPEEFGKLLQS